MTLKKTYVKDFGHQIVGTVTTGFSDSSAVVRAANGSMLGRISDRYNTTRDHSGRIVASNSADAGLLIATQKK